jgi:hypothetical protein
MKKPHIHAEVIRAYADGETIQYFDNINVDWFYASYPEFHEEIKYRVKPKQEYPKIELTIQEIYKSYRDKDDSCSTALMRISNEAIEHFITSGQLKEYIDAGGFIGTR